MKNKVIRVDYKIFTQNLFRTAYFEHFQCCQNHFWGKLMAFTFFYFPLKAYFNESSWSPACYRGDATSIQG